MATTQSPSVWHSVALGAVLTAMHLPDSHTAANAEGGSTASQRLSPQGARWHFITAQSAVRARSAFTDVAEG